MSCKVEGCNLSKYHYNPLITSLGKFHGKVVNTFDSLPKKDKVAEVAKRIVRLVAAPFAYLALGLAKLVGLAFNASWKKSHESALKKAELKKIEEQKKIEDSQGLTGLINALGGQEAVDKFPVNEKWDGVLKPLEMPGPVMRGFFNKGSPLFVFTYFKPNTEDAVEGIFQKQKTGTYVQHSEGLGWNNETGQWQMFGQDESELDLRPSGHILKGSVLEKHMLDRVSRLMKGEPVGMLQRYPGMGFIMPEDKTPFKPTDSYLKGEELEAYKKADTGFYEVEVEEGVTDLFLYDPREPAKSNAQKLLASFPKCVKKPAEESKESKKLPDEVRGGSSDSDIENWEFTEKLPPDVD